MSLPLLNAGGSSGSPSGAMLWGLTTTDFFIWEGNPDAGALLWGGTEDGLIWE